MSCPKSPPVPVGVNSFSQIVPGEVPKLFGGNVVEYLVATGSEIPLIVSSCIRTIEKEGELEESVYCGVGGSEVSCWDAGPSFALNRA